MLSVEEHIQVTVVLHIIFCSPSSGSSVKAAEVPVQIRTWLFLMNAVLNYLIVPKNKCDLKTFRQNLIGLRSKCRISIDTMCVK